MLGFSAYPTAIFDRTNHPGNNGAPYPYITSDMFYSYAQNRYNNTPNSQVNITVTNSSYNPATRVLSVSLNATALQSLNGQYKIVYVITEDNVVYPQTFYASCGTAGVHNDYIHKWIARYVVNTANGENLNTGTWNQNQVIPKTVSATLDNAWIAGNCNLNILVYKDSTASLYFSTVEQGNIVPLAGLVGISGTSGEVPSQYSLSQNYPNPFNPSTQIQYNVSKQSFVTIRVYDMTGTEVASLVNSNQTAGKYSIDFNASNIASGVYFYTMFANGSKIDTKKMMLVK
jgi:hypothetical protein